MKRGDVVVAASKGVYGGKPRPAIIVQTDLLNATHPSFILAPVTADLTGLSSFRIPISPNEENGLRRSSEIMIDKLFAVARDRVQKRIGAVDASTGTMLDRALAVVLGLV